MAEASFSKTKENVNLTNSQEAEQFIQNVINKLANDTEKFSCTIVDATKDYKEEITKRFSNFNNIINKFKSSVDAMITPEQNIEKKISTLNQIKNEFLS